MIKQNFSATLNLRVRGFLMKVEVLQIIMFTYIYFLKTFFFHFFFICSFYRKRTIDLPEFATRTRTSDMKAEDKSSP